MNLESILTSENIEEKIRSNEDYIFTKDYLNIENDVARLPYINIKSNVSSLFITQENLLELMILVL